MMQNMIYGYSPLQLSTLAFESNALIYVFSHCDAMLELLVDKLYECWSENNFLLYLLLMIDRNENP